MAFVNKRTNARCAQAPAQASSHKPSQVPASAFIRRRVAQCRPIAMLVGVILFLTTSAGFAQIRSEALWRVENSTPSMPAPLYDGQPSPFPIKEPPPPPEPEEPEEPEVVVNPEPVMTPAQRAAQQRANRTASLMSRIRRMLENNEAFEPDVSAVNVEAIVSGKAGEMAFIAGEWKFKGDYIKTTVATNSRLMELLSKLQQADNNLAAMVETEILENRSETGPFNLLVKDVASRGVTLRLPDGGSHVITFNSRGW